MAKGRLIIAVPRSPSLLELSHRGTFKSWLRPLCQFFLDPMHRLLIVALEQALERVLGRLAPALFAVSPCAAPSAAPVEAPSGRQQWKWRSTATETSPPCLRSLGRAAPESPQRSPRPFALGASAASVSGSGASSANIANAEGEESVLILAENLRSLPGPAGGDPFAPLQQRPIQ